MNNIIMSKNLFDLFDLIFQYDNNNVMIIIDNKNDPWFSGTDIASLLEYGNTVAAIANNVENIDKKQFSELKHFLNEIPKNSQPHEIFINEIGFYSLIFGSRKEAAIQFKQWVLRTVLPSIRQYGYYQMEQKYKDKLKFLNAKLTETKSRVNVLENNQKKQRFPNGGLVYALEPMGVAQKRNGKKIIRIGKSEQMKGRWSTYNTAVPDNFKLLYYVEADDPVAVEYCIKAMMNDYRYRSKKIIIFVKWQI